MPAGLHASKSQTRGLGVQGLFASLRRYTRWRGAPASLRVAQIVAGISIAYLLGTGIGVLAGVAFRPDAAQIAAAGATDGGLQGTRHRAADSDIPASNSTGRATSSVRVSLKDIPLEIAPSVGKTPAAPEAFEGVEPFLDPIPGPAVGKLPEIKPPRTPAPSSTGVPSEEKVTALPSALRPQWLEHAIPSPKSENGPMIAVVIDDIGIDQKRSRRMIGLPGPLTIALLPYGYNLRRFAAQAREAGHEIIVHVPMEPLDPEANPGPNALLTELDGQELQRRLRWDLTRFKGYVGVSSHMGSKFTVWKPGMQVVMRELRARGLLFFDSWTHNRSLGMVLSRSYGVPSVARDVFIDHDVTEEAIHRRLARLERIARLRGYSVGVAHPYDLTFELLGRWISEVGSRGFTLVPVSAVVRRRLKKR
jgi:polysaccharide deacetylase 2 family uncharacterized protein YibQ